MIFDKYPTELLVLPELIKIDFLLWIQVQRVTCLHTSFSFAMANRVYLFQTNDSEMLENVFQNIVYLNLASFLV